MIKTADFKCLQQYNNKSVLFLQQSVFSIFSFFFFTFHYLENVVKLPIANLQDSVFRV